MEDHLVRFHNAVNLNDVLLLAPLAQVPNRFHYTLTPVSRSEDDGGCGLVTHVRRL